MIIEGIEMEIIFIVAVLVVSVGSFIYAGRAQKNHLNRLKRIQETEYPEISFSYGDEVIHKNTGDILIVRSIGLYGTVTAVKKREHNNLNLPEFPWAYPYYDLELVK